MPDAFLHDGYLVLRGTPLELYNLIEDMDDELRAELNKQSNINVLCRQLAGLELDEVHEIRIRVAT